MNEEKNIASPMSPGPRRDFKKTLKRTYGLTREQANEIIRRREVGENPIKILRDVKCIQSINKVFAGKRKKDYAGRVNEKYPRRKDKINCAMRLIKQRGLNSEDVVQVFKMLGEGQSDNDVQLFITQQANIRKAERNDGGR
ncbi:MAG: hypothetical protein FWC68_02470 [Oscillospiraceae bacterium]|nr:hypothetical protein [Oscillospiraceae bacterium]